MTVFVLVLLLLLAVKHYVVDGPLQTPFMYLNKGNFNHPGGYVHAGLHGVGTFLAVMFAGATSDHYAVLTGFLELAGTLAVIDFVWHYAIDYSKVNLTAKYKVSQPQYKTVTENGVGTLQQSGILITSDLYFYFLIADQCLHFATYIGLAYLAGLWQMHGV